MKFKNHTEIPLPTQVVPFFENAENATLKLSSLAGWTISHRSVAQQRNKAVAPMWGCSELQQLCS